MIISFNEEKKIGDAIRSIEWADEVVVVDSGSQDRTREIAEGLGARVITRAWTGFASQKRFAADEAKFDWIFSLDADERVSPALSAEIIALRSNGPNYDAYTVPRLSIYMGRQIRHGGWYPDRQLRFFDRRKGGWGERAIHESIKMNFDATVGKLNGDLLHYSVDGPQHHALMIAERYAPLSAQQMFEEGQTTSRTRTVVSSISTFFRSYLFKMGILDGFPGLLIAFFAMQNTFLKHLILMELQGQAADSQKNSETTTLTTSNSSNPSQYS